MGRNVLLMFEAYPDGLLILGLVEPSDNNNSKLCLLS